MTRAGTALPVAADLTPAGLARVAEVLATRDDLWRRLVRAGARRWTTRVAGADGWEAWLVAWPGGERSAPEPQAPPTAVVLLAGELVAVGADRGRRLVPGVALAFGAGRLPGLWNPAGHLAVSLQVAPVRVVRGSRRPGQDAATVGGRGSAGTIRGTAAAGTDSAGPVGGATGQERVGRDEVTA